MRRDRLYLIVSQRLLAPSAGTRKATSAVARSTPPVTTSGMGSDGVTLRFVRNDSMTLPSRSQAHESHSRADDDGRNGAEHQREHRTTLRDAVRGEAVNSRGARDQRDEREDAEERGGKLQQPDLAGIEVRLDRADRRHGRRHVDLADERPDGVAERERIARRADDERHHRAPALERGALLGRLLPVQQVDQRRDF